MNNIRKVAFIIGSDTLFHLFSPIIELAKSTFYFDLYTLSDCNEKAEGEIYRNNLDVFYKGVFPIERRVVTRYDLIVFGNDWGAGIKSIIFLCRMLKIVTICIQESVIDFHDNKQRMLWADYALVQGQVSYDHLIGRNNVIIVGNSRYEEYEFSPCSEQLLLINSNFTYGISNEHQHFWLKCVIKTTNQLGIKKKIILHPRDNADLAMYETEIVHSDASKIKQLILSSSIVISRFSSLIHESILLGRKVIYYDPIGEDSYYDFECDDKVLYKAYDSISLKSCLEKALSRNLSENDFKNYINKHIDVDPEKKSSLRIIGVLESIPLDGYSGTKASFHKTVKYFINSVYYLSLSYFKIFIKALLSINKQ
jgi:hypothetical protein